MSTKYTIKGNEIHRNDELVATVVDGKTIMEKGQEKYLIPASKMAKTVIKNLKAAPTAKEEPKPFLPPKEELAEKNEASTTFVPKSEEPIETDAVTAPTDAELVKMLIEDNKKLTKDIKDLHNGVKVAIDPELIAPAIRVKRKGQHNPFGWDELPGVPPCPDGGEEGTKHPDVIDWAEKYYPELAEEVYENFNVAKRFLAARAANRKKKKDYANYK